MSKKRKICFVITAQNQYARSVLLLKELKRNRSVDLSIVVGGSAVLDAFGSVPEMLRKEGFEVAETMHMVLQGGTPVAMARTTGLGVIEFTGAFERLNPDIVVVRGDRYEVLSAAIAASYLNIPVAHIEGGDVSGTIDESVRHAITKLSHLHFVTNDAAFRRVIRMGEPKQTVYNVGAPEVEIASLHRVVKLPRINTLGVGAELDLKKPYLLVLNHPVTTEYGANERNTEELLLAVQKTGMQAVWFWPNVDAGTDEISGTIRRFREHHEDTYMRFLKYVSPAEFLELLRNAAAIVGNSSAGLKEASYFGTPGVNIGSRQHARLRGENIVDVRTYKASSIGAAISKQVTRGRYPRSTVYYKPGSSKKIASVLATAHPVIQKQFRD